jgi:hypothetical protein
MPGLVPGIHVFLRERRSKTWMAGTSGAKTALRAFCPGMTILGGHRLYLGAIVT